MDNAALSALESWLNPNARNGLSKARDAIGVALAKGKIGSAKDIGTWLTSQLHKGDLATDAVLMAHAYKSETDHSLAELSALSFAAHSPETGHEAMLRGSQFVGLTRDAWGIDLPDVSLPIAVGYTAHLMDAPLSGALEVYIEAEVDSALSIAAEAAGLEDTEISALKSELQSSIHGTAKRASQSEIEDIFANSNAKSDTSIAADDIVVAE